MKISDIIPAYLYDTGNSHPLPPTQPVGLEEQRQLVGVLVFKLPLKRLKVTSSVFNLMRDGLVRNATYKNFAFKLSEVSSGFHDPGERLTGWLNGFNDHL